MGFEILPYEEWDDQRYKIDEITSKEIKTPQKAYRKSILDIWKNTSDTNEKLRRHEISQLLRLDDDLYWDSLVYNDDEDLSEEIIMDETIEKKASKEENVRNNFYQDPVENVNNDTPWDTGVMMDTKLNEVGLDPKSQGKQSIVYLASKIWIEGPKTVTLDDSDIKII